MIEKPGVSLSIEPNERRAFSGPQQERLEDFVDRWFAFTGHQPETEFHLSIDDASDSHVGLGTGTQIGLAVSTLLFQFHFCEIPSIETLAQSVNRGGRSAVGTYGFLHGGFILDQGQKEIGELAKLGLHCAYPEDWRFVLIRTANPEGLSGTNENKVFIQSTDRLQENHDHLVQLARNSILPALMEEDFDKFAEGVFEFGKVSGSYFSNIQGGPFNGPRITDLVEKARNMGIRGVGQSSWGPTIYLLASSEDEANRMTEQMSELLLQQESIVISRPQNTGFQLESISHATP